MSTSTESITATLQHPVMHNGQQVNTVTVHRPSRKEIKLAQRQTPPGSDTDFAVSLLAQCSDLPREALVRLAWTDFEAIAEAADQGFFRRAERRSRRTRTRPKPRDRARIEWMDLVTDWLVIFWVDDFGIACLIMLAMALALRFGS